MAAYGTFAYELRDLVQAAWDAPVRAVTWRGWVLDGPPGARYRLAVYGPDDGHWDCYWEAELFPLGQALRPAFNYVKPQ